ncbi:unnamed protein product [Nezara viridula]|uniref:Uncharacterized protein n=1 Tax=Nezara viridula TaxID=85310 RepID=A0A9P0E9P5_NEZVI|nr:unnamed protein product [Nezara viridula]
MTISTKRLSGQVRVIRSRKFLTAVEMDNIKAIVSARLGIIAAENEELPTDAIELIERSLAIEAVSSEEDKEVQKLILSLLSQHMLYEGIPHDVRPTLSRIP